jgi:ribosome-binding factor A
MLGPSRSIRIAHVIRNSISDIIRNRMNKDSITKLCSISNVDVSGDKSNAKVFVTFLGDENAHIAAVTYLNDNKIFIRKELSKKVDLRYVPEISFIQDNTLVYAQHMQEILNSDET